MKFSAWLVFSLLSCAAIAQSSPVVLNGKESSLSKPAHSERLQEALECMDRALEIGGIRSIVYAQGECFWAYYPYIARESYEECIILAKRILTAPDSFYARKLCFEISPL